MSHQNVFESFHFYPILLWRTRPLKADTPLAQSVNRKYQTLVFIYKGEGDLITNFLRFLGFLLNLSVSLVKLLNLINW